SPRSRSATATPSADLWSLPGRVRPPSRSQHSTFPGGPPERPAFSFQEKKPARRRHTPRLPHRKPMIESPHNEKLKLVRKLRERKHREREGLFATEGEDLLAAGLGAGAAPRFVLVAAGSALEGEEVEPALLDSVSSLGSGTRAIAVWKQRWAPAAVPAC